MEEPQVQHEVTIWCPVGCRMSTLRSPVCAQINLVLDIPIVSDDQKALTVTRAISELQLVKAKFPEQVVAYAMFEIADHAMTVLAETGHEIDYGRF